MKKLLGILLVLVLSSINLNAIDLGLFYTDGFGGISATNERTFFGVGYTNVYDETNLSTGSIQADYWSFIFLVRDKPVVPLKINYLIGAGYSSTNLNSRSSVNANQYAIHIGIETKVSEVELKIMYIPLLFSNVKFPNEDKIKNKTTWNEGLRLLVNVPF